MISQPEISQRTIIRDLVVRVLGGINSEEDTSAWRTTPELHNSWLSQEQCTRYPALCVIITDEEYEQDRQQGITVHATLKIIGYARDENDCRGALDALIEDVIRCLSASEEFRGALDKLELTSTICDEGSSVAKPFSQFVMSWAITFTRAFGYGG